jgi:hypothetical protein
MDQTQALYAMIAVPMCMIVGAVLLYWLFD